MKYLNRNAALLSFLILPTLAAAHPGHDGDQTHGMAGVVLLAATFVAVKRVLVVVKSRRARSKLR